MVLAQATFVELEHDTLHCWPPIRVVVHLYFKSHNSKAISVQSMVLSVGTKNHILFLTSYTNRTVELVSHLSAICFRISRLLGNQDCVDLWSIRKSQSIWQVTRISCIRLVCWVTVCINLEWLVSGDLVWLSSPKGCETLFHWTKILRWGRLLWWWTKRRFRQHFHSPVEVCNRWQCMASKWSQWLLIWTH